MLLPVEPIRAKTEHAHSTPSNIDTVQKMTEKNTAQKVEEAPRFVLIISLVLTHDILSMVNA